jgi:hypothetical protein
MSKEYLQQVDPSSGSIIGFINISLVERIIPDAIPNRFKAYLLTGREYTVNGQSASLFNVLTSNVPKVIE